MTWTLRAYDANGVEIGWVTSDPFDYEITHPDGTAAASNERVRHVFSMNEEPAERNVVVREGFTMKRTNYLDLTPKEHVEYIRDELKNDTDAAVDSMQIADE